MRRYEVRNHDNLRVLNLKLFPSYDHYIVFDGEGYP